MYSLQPILIFFFFVMTSAQMTLDDAWKEFHIEEDVQEDDYYKLGLGIWGYTAQSLNEFYFGGHDTDHDTKLDGLELMNSLLKREVPFSHAEYIVDFILKESDTDRDGLLDYAEYLNSRKQRTQSQEHF